MPPIRGQKAQKLVEQEGRVLLAIKAIKNGRFTSVAAAARSFEVPRSTLQDRMKGVTSWSGTRAIGHKFTQLEVETIQDWLISIDHRGAALTIAMLRDMAILLLENRGDHTPQTVSKNWPTQFIKRHPEPTTRFSRKYDYKKAENENPAIILEWFKLVEKTIRENGITWDDIYNFDESGFAMGVGATTKFTTQSLNTGLRGVFSCFIITRGDMHSHDKIPHAATFLQSYHRGLLATCTRASYRDSWPLLLQYHDVKRMTTNCCSHGRSVNCYSSFLAAQTRCT
jgi:hypothetical protein